MGSHWRILGKRETWSIWNMLYFKRIHLATVLKINYKHSRISLLICSIRVWLIPHTSKEMLKSLQARLQQFVNHELPDVQAGFRKGRETRDQIANICWIIEKAREFQKTSTSALLTMPKPLTVWITTNCGKFWKRWDYQTTWPASWEICIQIRKQQLELGTDWFQIRKGVCQGCILSHSLFNLYAEYIMRNAGLEEAQAGIDCWEKYQ